MADMFRTLLLAAALAGFAENAAAQPAERYDVPAMPLREALVSLARQAGVSIAFDGLALDGFRSEYVVGAGNLSGALDTILANTPYTYEFTGVDTLRLVVRPEDAAHLDEAQSDVRGSANSDIILVTATKRAADARTLPVSISAIEYDALASWGAADISDLAPRLAGVAFTNLGTSRNKIFVRGLSDGPFADRTQSTVGVYLDEMPIILNDTNPDLRLIDMDRIEIARGPQGSLYGGGSIGGIFKMITAKPDLDAFSGRARITSSQTQDGGANGALDGVINLPIVENKLAARAVGYFEELSGYVDDIGLGKSNVNSSEIYGGRIALRYRPSDTWTVDALMTRQLVDLDGAQYVFAGLNGLARDTARREPYRDAFNLGNISVNGVFGGAALTSSTSYILRRTNDDLDASAALPALLSVADAEGIYRSSDKIRSFVHETRIASVGEGDWRWLAGAFVSSHDECLVTGLIVDSTSPLQTPFYSDRNDHVLETALFGEVSHAITPRLEITLGARLARTTYEVDVESGGVFNVGAAAIGVRNTNITLAPKLALTYRVAPEFLTYAQISHGSRIGGVNVTTPLAALFDSDEDAEEATRTFESDTLWNVEAGVKTQWLDGAISLNASVFYVIWNDVQTDQFLPSGFSFIANAGRARNYGFEFESVIQPIENLELTAALFWNSPEIRDANPFLGASPGDALPNIAELSAGFSATYEAQLSPRWSALITGNVNYVGRSYLTFNESVAPPMGEYFESNVRLSLQREKLKAGLFVENLGNERGNTFSFGNPFSLSATGQETPLRPRTIGLFVEKEF